MNKIWYIRMVEHYSAFKRKEIRTHVPWINQEVILSEMNQTQKEKFRVIPLVWVT